MLRRIGSTGYTAVILRFEEGDSDTADRFPASLKSSAGADLLVCSSTQYAEARALAAAVARHLHLEIEDASSDHPVRLSADQADLPLHLYSVVRRALVGGAA